MGNWFHPLYPTFFGHGLSLFSFLLLSLRSITCILAPASPAASTTTTTTTTTTTASKLSTSILNEQSTEAMTTKEYVSDLSTTLSQTQESDIVLTTSMTEGSDILHTSSMTEGSDMLNTTEKSVNVQTTAAFTPSKEGDGNKGLKSRLLWLSFYFKFEYVLFACYIVNVSNYCFFSLVLPFVSIYSYF